MTLDPLHFTILSEEDVATIEAVVNPPEGVIWVTDFSLEDDEGED